MTEEQRIADILDKELGNATMKALLFGMLGERDISTAYSQLAESLAARLERAV